MQRFARWVLGYHGCTKELATQLIGGELAVEAWRLSENPHDWLGRGIYFWEHGPERAAAWAHRRHGSDADVVGAIIQLGQCFDLLDVRFTHLLLPAYERERELVDDIGGVMPSNTGRTPELGKRELDCLVINSFLQASPGRGVPDRARRVLGGTAGLPRRDDHARVAHPDRRPGSPLHPRRISANLSK